MSHTPAQPQFLFTYGTLMSTVNTVLGSHERNQLAAHARLIGRGQIRGRLYDVGACPAALSVPDARSFVHGEVWLIPSRAHRLLTVLDRYEGCEAGAAPPYPYLRTATCVAHELGWEFVAWAYVWNRQTRGLRLVRSGVWQPPDGEACLPATGPGRRSPTAAVAVTDKAA